MRKLLLVLVAGAALALAAAADGHEDEDGAAEGDEVSTADVLEVLEEINRKLDHDERMSDRASDKGFGGGPFFPLRYMPGAAGLNDYFKKLGQYAAMSEFFIPFVNGGGGTWRWSVDGSLQFGMEYSGLGQEAGGYAWHDDDPNGPGDTVDADGDGKDDYYSYVGYAQRYFAGIAQYKWKLAPSVYLQTGIKTGLGWEALRYGLNRRQVLSEALGVDSGANSWSRTSLLGSAYAGLQIALDGDRNVVKLALEVGADGHYPISEWRPGSGVHKGVPAPPATLQAHNFWVALGPQFHY